MFRYVVLTLTDGLDPYHTGLQEMEIAPGDNMALLGLGARGGRIRGDLLRPGTLEMLCGNYHGPQKLIHVYRL